MRISPPCYDILSRIGKMVTRKAYPLHCDEDIEPCFIIGSGRSGTTLLRRMLVASEQIHIPPETYVLSQVIDYYRRNAHQDWTTLVQHCMALFELHPEFDTFQITLRPLLPRIYALPKHQRSLAKILDMFYRYHAEQTGVSCERWGDKTPINTFALDDIYAVFPKAKFIHLLRDGVDVVHSCMQRGLIPKLEDAAQRWRQALLAVERFQSLHEEACLELRYETLVQEPERVLLELSGHLQICYKKSMVYNKQAASHWGDANYAHYASTLEKVNHKHIGQGRALLSVVELQKLQSVIGYDLQRVGYAKICEENNE